MAQMDCGIVGPVSTTPNLVDVAAILRRWLPGQDYRAVLFGSRANGTAHPGSDWDIGILGPEPLRGAVLERIREDLEALRTLHTFDVVDLSTVPPDLRMAATSSGLPLL